jgi:CBS domain-containing protein
MAIKDVMSRDVCVVGPDDPIQQAATRMAEEDVGFIPVCDGERLVGVITDRDLAIRAVAGGADPATTKVRELMTEDVTWCYEDQDVAKTAELMKRNDIRRIIVVDRDKRLVGVVALGDLARQQPGHSEDVLTDVSSAPPQK